MFSVLNSCSYTIHDPTGHYLILLMFTCSIPLINGALKMRGDSIVKLKQKKSRNSATKYSRNI